MIKMILAGLLGAAAGYAWYRVVGCATGSCPLTSNPYTSTLYGAAMGLMLTASSLTGGAVEGFRVVPPAEAAALAEKPATFVLDVRTPQEYAQGRLERAVLVPVDELESRLGELPVDKTQPLLVYCASGRRSRAASRLLAEKGYTAVHDLKGGIASWESEGRPVTRRTEKENTGGR